MPEKMPVKKCSEEVGDLFVTETLLTIKLLPSKKEGTRQIRWFENGSVTNVQAAAKDIAALIGKVGGRRLTIRALTVMTEMGITHDIAKCGLHAAVKKAGFEVLR